MVMVSIYPIPLLGEVFEQLPFPFLVTKLMHVRTHMHIHTHTHTHTHTYRTTETKEEKPNDEVFNRIDASKLHGAMENAMMLGTLEVREGGRDGGREGGRERGRKGGREELYCLC